MGVETFHVLGADFDAAAVPKGTRRIQIDTVVKKDRKRLEGLAGLPITELELRRVSAPDLTETPLPETLEVLELWQCRGLKSLDGIQKAARLRVLRWWWMPPLEDATALADLPALRVLRIVGGMNDKQKVANLDFLAGLKLDELMLNGIGPANLDITPVLALDGLKRFAAFGPDFEPAVMARLAARFPALHAELKRLEDFPEGMGNLCKSCGGTKKMLMLRGRKFLWCPICEAEGIAKEFTRFDAMVEAARQDGVEALSGVQLAME